MSIWVWIVFNVAVAIMLILDMKVFNKDAHEISLKEALMWSGIWIGISLVFGGFIWYFQGPESGLEFFTGYLIEKSLSIDNIFVFIMIFSYFNVPAAYQRRVLTWGVIGAIVMRAFFIFAGVALLEAFHWMIYLFGGFLILTSIRMFREHTGKLDPENNPIIKTFRKIMPVSDEYDGSNFFTRKTGKLMGTPLLIVLLMIESSDLIFAVDSIPAILAITDDTFIIYTSNILAILGLRALYFALAGVIDKFVYLRQGLAIVLAFVGFKMVLSGVIDISTLFALGVVGFILIASIAASLIKANVEKGK